MSAKISVCAETQHEERGAGDICIDGEEGRVRMSLQLESIHINPDTAVIYYVAPIRASISQHWVLAAERSFFCPQPTRMYMTMRLA